jgi:hypothetical protein|tara:strand:+ start:170 stop:388 length:219 start_codon:yes stop_codon:yes gene_type:complete
MAGYGIAKKGLGLLKHGSKERKALRKVPFGKLVDFPIEVMTKQKKAAALGTVVGASANQKLPSKKIKEEKKK